MEQIGILWEKFFKTKKGVGLQQCTASHMLIRLEKVGEWFDEEGVHNIIKENDLKEWKTISKIHRIHKRLKWRNLLKYMP